VCIHLAIEHALELEAAHAPFEAARIALDVARGTLIVLAFGQLEQLGRIGDGLGRAVELGKLGGQPGTLAAQLLRLVRFLPERGIFQLAIDLLEALFLRVVLKETP
jgi:hypothetical protein